MPNRFSAAIVSAVTGFAAAFAACFVFFYFVYKPSVVENPRQLNQNVASPLPITTKEIPDPEIKAAEVRTVSIKTVYKGYFDPRDKCAKTYNEYFGNEDSISSPSSPCTVEVTFMRDGSATRSMEIRRWDKTARAFRVVESSSATARISPEQFNLLVDLILGNDAFESWREGTSINVSNCSISAVHIRGTKTVMSNVDERAMVFLQMVDAFGKMERQLDWKAS